MTKQDIAKSSWRDHKKIHPAANVFPLMSPDELRKLADDIQAHGLCVPIQTRTADGELYVIDGRNRLDACELLDWQLVDAKGNWRGKITEHIEYKSRNHKEIIAEVISFNLQRRHLNESQRAMYAAELATLKPGKPGKCSNLSNKAVSQSESATLLNVGRTSVQTAKKVLDKAPAKIVEAVKSGALAVSKAFETTKPKATQRAERLAKRSAKLAESEAELAEMLHAQAFWMTTPQAQRDAFIRKHTR